MLEAPFQKEISQNYNKAKSAYEHSETCKKNRATRRKIVARVRKEAWTNTLYAMLFGVCFFFGSLIVLGWTI
nr:MAG TPA: hypothetical protein [Caudoviricetes sp.]